MRDCERHSIPRKSPMIHQLSVRSAGLLLLALAGCSRSPSSQTPKDSAEATTNFGRPVVLARAEGEARTFQGRRPLWIKVDPVTQGSRAFTAAMEDLPPGDSIGIHKHLTEDEVIFVHRGTVDVTLGDSVHRGETGALVFVPRGTWIGFRVVGADTATIVFLFNTPGFEKCLRFLSAPVGTTFVRPADADIAAARKECHQVRYADEVH